MNNQLIYRNGGWGCKRTHEDPNEQYICPNWYNAEKWKSEAKKSTE